MNTWQASGDYIASYIHAEDTCRPQRQLHKFGGSSLADSEGYRRVANIISEYSEAGDLLVVSAAGDTTNRLIDWLTLSQRDPLAAHQLQQSLRQYQQQLISELLNQPQPLINALHQDLHQLAILLSSGGDHSISEAIYAEIVGHGEIWSARLLAALLVQQGMAADWLDSRSFLRAPREAQPKVDASASQPLLQQQLIQHPQKRLVITGFICRNQAGETVLLGRNGSDYSATQIGALAGVARVTIWSDVAGVYSADPRKVSDACLLPLLRLDEASELARLAASVLHTRTLQPIASSDIDLLLRCSYQPQQGSTRIERILASGQGARIVTSHDDCCLIDCQLSDDADIQFVWQQLEHLLTDNGLRPLACALHADRRLIQLCYISEIVDGVLAYLQQACHSHHDLTPASLTLRHNFALIALVGAGVCRHPLHSHRFWQQLADQPIEFIWQADDAISIVAVLRNADTLDSQSLLRGLHQALFRAEKRVGLVLFGNGNIGTRWLELFAREQQRLNDRHNMEFVLTGVFNSRCSLCDYNGLAASRALAFASDEVQPYDQQALLHWLRAHPYDELILLDVTASEQLAACYTQFARLGCHLISVNKLAAASDSDSFQQIRNAFVKTGRHWLYNATAGAGLPVNHSVRDLRESGDTILAISGIFSGTLSWLFLQFDGSVPFSQLVDQAWQQGLTEPDPRADLCGDDVRRKLVILAREAGYDLEPQQVRVESLVPASCANGSVDDFFEQAEALNRNMQQRLDAAREHGLVLRYVARFEASGKARVRLEALRHDHPLAALLPCDNIFAIESFWYRDNPLIIRGPGAGRDVTAGAIQSDINRLARLL